VGVTSCIFCQIIQGKLEASIVARGDGFVAFLDKTPLFRGHVLVVPPVHRETLADLEPDEVGPLFSAVRRISAAVPKALGAAGSFVAMNNKISQSVPHLHVHVVPRNRGDGLRGFFWPRQKYADAAEMEAFRAKLADALDES
jgi:histidine triad (HIT) family protein